jgi:hypothetical protein
MEMSLLVIVNEHTADGMYYSLGHAGCSGRVADHHRLMEADPDELRRSSYPTAVKE